MKRIHRTIRNYLFSMRGLLLVYAATVTVLVVAVWWQADQIAQLPLPEMSPDNVTGQVTGVPSGVETLMLPDAAEENYSTSGTQLIQEIPPAETAAGAEAVIGILDDPSRLPQAMTLADQQPLRQALLWPVERVEIITAYGRYMSPTLLDWRHHAGIDLAASVGTAVRATLPGTVVDIREDEGLGRVVIVEHSGGLQSRYANLGQIKVELGEKVDQGQYIAEIGQTARYESAEEAHLHWELWQNGVSVDPLSFIEPIE